MNARSRDTLSAVVGRQRGRARMRAAVLAAGAAGLVAAGAVAITLPAGVTHPATATSATHMPATGTPAAGAPATVHTTSGGSGVVGATSRLLRRGVNGRARREPGGEPPPRAAPDDGEHRRAGRPGGVGHLARPRHRRPGDRRRGQGSPRRASCWRPTWTPSTWPAAGSGRTREIADLDRAMVRGGPGPGGRCSPLLAEAIAVALRAARLTGGDVQRQRSVPPMNAVGYDRDFALDPAAKGPAVRLTRRTVPGWQPGGAGRAGPPAQGPPFPGVRLDLGATAKPWAADRSADPLAAGRLRGAGQPRRRHRGRAAQRRRRLAGPGAGTL